jgi:hypothetical protein
MAAASAAADIVCFVTSSGLTTYASSVANCAASSIDLKNPIGEIDPDVAIKKVMALRPAIYTFKDPQEYGPLPYVGLYAQDVCKMDERLCFYDGNLREPTNGAAIHNYDKVGVTAYLVAAIQAQQREIDQLRRERHRRHRSHDG